MVTNDPSAAAAASEAVSQYDIKKTDCYLGDKALCASLEAVMNADKFGRMVNAAKGAFPLQAYAGSWSMTAENATRLRLAGVQVYSDVADYKPTGRLLNIEHTVSQHDIKKMAAALERDDVKDYAVCFVNFALACEVANQIKSKNNVTDSVKPDTLRQRHAACKCRMCAAWRALSAQQQAEAWGSKAWPGRFAGLAPPCQPILWYPGAPPARG